MPSEAIDASAVLDKLREIWRSIGVTPEEEAQRVASLVTDAEAERDALVEELATADAESLQIARALGRETEEAAVLQDEAERLSLRLRREARAAALQKLRAQKDEAVAQQSARVGVVVRLTQEMGDYSVAHAAGEIDYEDLSEARIQALDAAVDAAQRERDARAVRSQESVDEISSLVELLSVEDSDADDSAAPLSEARLAALSARVGALREAKVEREALLEGYGREITEAWAKLDVPDAEQQAFFDSSKGIGASTVKACENELRRLKELRAASIRKLISAELQTIAALRTEMGMAEDDADAIAEDDASEETLSTLEARAAALTERALKLRPILADAEKRAALIDEKASFEESTKDPKRLLSRGGGSLMLKEEKQRKRFKKLIPAIEARLRAAVTEWEEAEGAPLEWRGGRLLDSLPEPAAPRRQSVVPNAPKHAAEPPRPPQAKADENGGGGASTRRSRRSSADTLQSSPNKAARKKPRALGISNRNA